MKTLMILLSILLFNATSFAQEHMDDLIAEIFPKIQLSNEELTLLKEEMKIHSMLLEGVKRVEIENGSFKNIAKATNTVYDLIIHSAGARSSLLPKEIKSEVTSYIQESTSKEQIKKLLIDLKNFAQTSIGPKDVKKAPLSVTLRKPKHLASKFIRNQKVLGVSIARRFGIQAALVYLVTLQLDTTLPLILISMGHAHIGAPLLVAPISTAATGLFVAGTESIKMRKTIKFLGGKEKFFNNFKLLQKIKKGFGKTFFTNYNLIDVIVNDKTYVFTVEDQNLISRLKSKMGYNKNLNYDSLLKFLKEQKVNEQFINLIEKSSKPRDVKMLVMLQRIKNSSSSELMAKLEGRFSKHISTLKGVPRYTYQRNWILQISQSKSIKEFLSYLNRIPDNIPPKTFDRIWKGYILKNAAKNIGPFMSKETYNFFRNLVSDYDKIIRPHLFHSEATTLNKELKKSLRDYVHNSMGPVQRCSMDFIPPKAILIP